MTSNWGSHYVLDNHGGFSYMTRDNAYYKADFIESNSGLFQFNYFKQNNLTILKIAAMRGSCNILVKDQEGKTHVYFFGATSSVGGVVEDWPIGMD
jgi:hypothetical protein